MLNEVQTNYCDGAAMAYNDMANKIESMIQNAPKEIKSLMETMQPMADAARVKAKEVYVEATRFMGLRQ